jgi:hypothetical protein
LLGIDRFCLGSCQRKKKAIDAYPQFPGTLSAEWGIDTVEKRMVTVKDQHEGTTLALQGIKGLFA